MENPALYRRERQVKDEQPRLYLPLPEDEELDEQPAPEPPKEERGVCTFHYYG